jgi:CRP-like cAMP-binding protein
MITGTENSASDG